MCHGFLKYIISQAEDTITELERKALYLKATDSVDTEEITLINGLEEVFRLAIVRDSMWIPKPRFNKSRGGDPFSVFVASVVRAKHGQMSDESAQRIIRRTKAVRARTSPEK